MRISMIGTRGLPARYGGFETAIYEISRRLVKDGSDVNVYCRNIDQSLCSLEGVRLTNLPAIRRKELETLSHTALSVIHAIFRDRPDVAIVFNAANAPLIPILKAAGIPVALHLDGLEWKRSKWSSIGRSYFRWAEGFAVRYADAIVVDAYGIADYIQTTYNRSSVLIAYGAPIIHPGSSRLAEAGLEQHSYHLVVARFEPENHVREIVVGYVNSSARCPLVVVGSAPYSHSYTAMVHAAAAGDDRVRFPGALWDQDLLNQLYANALSYLHGHSVGGTNPSLLRAMGAGAPVTAYDCVFNREVAGSHARFFSGPATVESSVMADEGDVRGALERGQRGRSHAKVTYRWDSVSEAYGRLCASLCEQAVV